VRIFRKRGQKAKKSPGETRRRPEGDERTLLFFNVQPHFSLNEEIIKS
jgi:hypothetical protein